MGKMSRRKGKTGEREVAALLRAHGLEAKRGVQHRGGPDSPDVICPQLADWHVEVKRVEALALYAALEQARADCGPLDRPVVFHRRSKKPWVVVLLADDYLALIKKTLEEK